MARVSVEEFRVFLPLLADVLMRRWAAQRLELSSKTRGHEKRVQVPLQLIMGFIIIPLSEGGHAVGALLYSVADGHTARRAQPCSNCPLAYLGQVCRNTRHDTLRPNT